MTLMAGYGGAVIWQNDEEDVDSKFIFYGPVQLQGHGPFSVPDLGMVTK